MVPLELMPQHSVPLTALGSLSVVIFLPFTTMQGRTVAPATNAPPTATLLSLMSWMDVFMPASLTVLNL